MLTLKGHEPKMVGGKKRSVERYAHSDTVTEKLLLPPLFLPRARTRYLRMCAMEHTILHKRDERRRGRNYHFGFMDRDNFQN